MLRSILRRIALHIPRYQAIQLGAPNEPEEVCPHIWSGSGTPTETPAAASVYLDRAASVASDILQVRHAGAYVKPITVAAAAASDAQDTADAAVTAAAAAQDTADGAVTDAATAQAAADAAQGTADGAVTDAATAQAAADAAQGDVDDVNTLLGDMTTLIPVLIPDLATGFSSLVTQLSGKLATASLPKGSLAFASGDTFKTVAVANNDGALVICFPLGNMGAASYGYGVIAGGTLTMTLDAAPGGAGVTMGYLVLGF